MQLCLHCRKLQWIFYQKLSRPLEESQTTTRLKTRCANVTLWPHHARLRKTRSWIIARTAFEAEMKKGVNKTFVPCYEGIYPILSLNIWRGPASPRLYESRRSVSSITPAIIASSFQTCAVSSVALVDAVQFHFPSLSRCQDTSLSYVLTLNQQPALVLSSVFSTESFSNNLDFR